MKFAVLAFGFAVVIGVFYGFYPARKAALNPVDDLRYK
jgi:putative ABC transport system permease protein